MAPAALYRGAWAVSACLPAFLWEIALPLLLPLHAPRLAPEDDQGNSAPPTGKMLLERGTDWRAGGRAQPEEEAISNPKCCIGNTALPSGRWGDGSFCGDTRRAPSEDAPTVFCSRSGAEKDAPNGSAPFGRGDQPGKAVACDLKPGGTS